MSSNQPRISVVKSFKLRSLLIGGTIQFGDCLVLAPRCKVLAISRQLPIFSDRENDLSQYPLYSRRIPLPIITESINVNILNQSPYIRTGDISIHGVSTSGTVQIGSNLHIDTEARVKHLRQFLFPPELPKEAFTQNQQKEKR